MSDFCVQGFEVVLTTGTDEHGQKVERSAKAAGQSPEEFTTIVAEEFREQWERFNLSIDHFQRTSDPRQIGRASCRERVCYPV